MGGGNGELTLERQKQEQEQRELRLEIRQQLTSVQNWDGVGEAGTVEERREAYGARLIQREKEENATLVAHVMESYELADAQTAAQGEAQMPAVPAKKTWKQRQEEAKRTAEVKKITSVGDYGSYKILSDIKRSRKERDNSCTPELMRQGQQVGVDERVLRSFVSGHRSHTLNKQERKKKAEDREFLEDYISKDINRRWKHLERITKEMLKAEVTEEMLEPAYLEEHSAEVIRLNDRMTYFQNIMNDEVNRAFFDQLPPLEKQLLRAKYGDTGGSMGALLVNRLTEKGIELQEGRFYQDETVVQRGEQIRQPARQVTMAEQMKEGLLAAFRQEKKEIQQREDAVYQQALEEEMERVRQEKKQEYRADLQEGQEVGFGFTTEYLSLYAVSEMEKYRDMIESAPEVFAEHQDALKILYQQLYRQYDVLNALNLEHNSAQEVAEANFQQIGPAAELGRRAWIREEDVHMEIEMVNEQINATAEAIKFYVKGSKLSGRAMKQLEQLGLAEQARQLSMQRMTPEEAAEKAVEVFVEEVTMESQQATLEQIVHEAVLEEVQAEPQQDTRTAQQRMEEKLKGLNFNEAPERTIGKSGRDVFMQGLSPTAITRLNHGRENMTKRLKEYFADKNIDIDLDKDVVFENATGDVSIAGFRSRRTLTLLMGALGGDHTVEELAPMIENMMAGSRYRYLKTAIDNKDTRENVREQYREELKQYTPEKLQELDEQFDQGIYQMKQLQFEQLCRLQEKYGRYLSQLHPEDFMETVGPEFFDDVGLLQDVKEMLASGGKYFKFDEDSEQGKKDRLYRDLWTYFDAAHILIKNYMICTMDGPMVEKNAKQYDEAKEHQIMRNLEKTVGGIGFSDDEQAAYEEKVRQRAGSGEKLDLLGRFMSREQREANERAEQIAGRQRTREEAINTYSDKQSDKKRNVLRGLALGFQKDSPLRVALENYFSGKRYEVGYTEERRRLQAAIGEVEKAWNALTKEEQQDANNSVAKKLKSIKDYFAEVTNGTLQVSEEAEVLDFSNQRPTEQGSIEWGSKRNAIIRGFSYWSDQKDTPLFSHEPTVNDLKQRMVSNCYMVAGTAGLVNVAPEMLKECIKDNLDGTVTVRLHEKYTPEEERQKEAASKAELQRELDALQEKVDAGEVEEWEVDSQEMEINARQYKAVQAYRPIYVTVSKEIPRMAGGVDTLSAGALWMQMIEKACAFVGRGQKDKHGKEIKGYKSLWYGEGGEFLERLLGIAPEQVGTATKTDELFEDICNCQQNRVVYNTGTGGNVGKEDGLNTGHAYTIMGGKTVGDKRYVLLRNPYSTMSMEYQENGQKSRTGKHLDTHSDETYGQFYMEYEEFLSKFQGLTRTDLKKAPGVGN